MGRNRVFAPAESLNARERQVLHWLDNELRLRRWSVSMFCRERTLNRHNLANLMTGWKRTMEPALLEVSRR